MTRSLIIAIMLLWSLPAIAAFTSFSVNGAGTVPPPFTPTYYIYGF